jgi:hypothetical protein
LKTTPHGSARLVAHILTLNEERNISAAIRSVKQVTDDVVVVDSFSSDATCEIAEREGATVWRHPFDNWAAQHNWALDRVEAEYGCVWHLAVDADERVTGELASEIRRQVLDGAPRHDVYLVKRLLRFSGRVLRHGGFSKTKLPRLFRASSGRYEIRAVNEHFLPFQSSSLGELKQPIIHDEVESWDQYISKHNRYSSLEARERLRLAENAQRTSLSAALRQPNLRRRWMRERVWHRLPARPFMRFLQIYVLAGGFLDGSAGYRIAVFQSWHEMCIDLKHEQLLEQMSTRATPDSIAHGGPRPHEQ